MSSATDKYQSLVEAEQNDSRFELVSIKTIEGEIKGRWWGPKNVRPILCLHGWLDNCGVFDELIPLLPQEYGYLALDIPGHGRSYSRPIGMGYSILDFLVFMERIRKFFQWEKISLLVHSMSGVRSFYYSAVNTGKVDLLIALDNLEPYNFNTIDHMRNEMKLYLHHVDDNKSKRNEEPPSYPYEEILERIHKGSTRSIPVSLAHHLVVRGVLPSKKYPGKYYFSADPTWKAVARHPHHEEHTKLMARYIKLPVLYIIGNDSHVRDWGKNYSERIIEYWKPLNPELQVVLMDGKHHFLLTRPQATADHIIPFLKKYRPVEVKNKM